jgi:[ribosomal protein S5]-alanine N-acetyltransferase
MLIETSRLLIRHFKAGDWQDVMVYCADPAVMHYIPLGLMNEEEVKEFVAEEPNQEIECYAIELKSNNQVIGQMIFHPWFMERTYEIGWIINPLYQNQGYASEAAKAFLKYGFQKLKLHRIIATCQPENPSSWKVAEKIGMRREGIFQKSILKENNVWWDECLYAILESEYPIITQSNPFIP